MIPTTLAAVPAAIEALGGRANLDASVATFLRRWQPPHHVTHAVETVAAILRIGSVRALCTAEADQLLLNRYPPEIARLVRHHLWGWLSASDRARYDYSAFDDDKFDDHELDDDELPPFAGAGPYLAPKPREVLPSIEAPPQRSQELQLWAEKYGVRERLADPMDVRRVRGVYYQVDAAGLPATIRDAVLVTADKLAGVARYYRRELASQLVSAAKSYLHRAAQAVALGRRRHAERSARLRDPDDPFVARLLEVIRRVREQLSPEVSPRPVGAFLPGSVHLDQLELDYYEWDINDGRTPEVESGPVLLVSLSTWESGSLHLECRRCRGAATCPHGRSALDRISEILRDPTEPLAEALGPVLRVPGWARLFDRLDTGLGKLVEVGGDDQRLVWQIGRQSGKLAVSPLLQALGKHGNWSRGRRIRVEELENEPHLLRDPVNRGAFEGLMYSTEPTHAYYNNREQTPRQVWRALAALAGSSRVFPSSSRGVPLSVRKVRPALKVEPTDGGFRLCLGLGPVEIEPATLLASAPDGRHVVFVDENQGRCLLALLEPETTALLTAMVAFPVTLPTEALGDLLGRLPRLQGGLDLHLPEAVRGERVEPPVTTVCRLSPLPEAGVRLDMAVRPIEGGPIFPPGEGTAEVLHAREGSQVHALRGLGAERERAAHLAQVLGLDESAASGAWRWDLADDGVALALLQRLRDLPDLAQVEWPEGEIRVESVSRGALKVQVRRRHDWFGVDGGIEIDGARVSLSELLAAARAGRCYVRLDGRRLAALEDDLRERLAALDDVVFQNQGALELGLLAAPVLAELVEDRSQLDMVPAFRGVLGRLEAARGEKAVLPDGLNATLRHYQSDGFEWLARLSDWGLGACLADDMGLGKTVQALALLLRRAELGPALVIAPTSVVANWAAECAKFAPVLSPRIYRGPGRAALLEGLDKGSLLVTSYAIAVRDAEALGALSFATLIVDEAQSVKNALTQRFRAIRDLRADFRLALTGTPIENHLGELWAIFRLVTPGLLGSWEHFRERFAVPIERHHDRNRQAALARVVRPFLLRRTKAEVAPELPARTEMNQTIELGPSERRLYEAARIEVLESLAKGAAAGDDAKQRIKILAALTRLRLLCCHPRLVVKDSTASSSKLAALVELLTELRDEGHRALVFSQFTSFLDLARPLLVKAGLRTLTLDGSTPAAEREDLVRAFQAGTADVFLLSLRAGGTGLNLTAATYVIHLDPWWNPAVEDQATDRAHRIGQDRPVTVIRMVVRGTIEEAVLSLHEEKRQLAASILDGADVAARLDSGDLLDLIRKSGESADEEPSDEPEVGENGGDPR